MGAPIAPRARTSLPFFTHRTQRSIMFAKKNVKIYSVASSAFSEAGCRRFFTPKKKKKN